MNRLRYAGIACMAWLACACSGTTVGGPLAEEPLSEAGVDAKPEASHDAADGPEKDGQEAGIDAQDAPEEPLACVSPDELFSKQSVGIDVRIDLSAYDQGVYQVHEVIEVVASQAGSSLTFFGENFTFADTSTPHAYDGHTATFCVPPFQAGDKVSVQADYQVPESELSKANMGLHTWSNGMTKLVGPFLEPYFASSWLLVPQSLYGTSAEHDENVAVDRVALEVVTPSEDWVVSGPGGAAQQQGTHYKFALDKPMPLYAFSFAAAPGYSRSSVGKTPDGLEVFSVAPTQVQGQVAATVQTAVDTAAWMEANLAPYAWGPSLDIVLVPTFGGGMEHTSALWVGTELTLFSGENKFVMAHETVHQWLGDAVRFADWPHFWVAEGFTEWVTNYRVWDALFPSDSADRRLKYRNDAATMCSDTTYGPLRFPDGEDFMTRWETMDVYYVYGAAFLQMVHARLIRDFNLSFDTVLTEWYAAKQLQDATTEQFRDFLAAKTGDAAYWNTFFNEWAFASPCPVLAFENYAFDGASLSFDVTRKNASAQALDGMPIVVETGSGSQTLEVTMASGASSAKVQATLSAAPTKLSVDPDNTHVFVLQTANWTGPAPQIVAAQH